MALLFRSGMSLGDLANLSRRLATSLEAGIDVRKVMAREAELRSRPGVRRQLESISLAVASGRSFSDAVQMTGEFFPPLFRSMVEVGEETGHLSEVFRHLAEHYEHQVKLRRIFLSSLTWPAIQLFAALTVVGLVIWLLGVLSHGSAEPADILGFGLIGTSGLIVYLCILAAIAALVIVIVQGIRKGLVWAKPLQKVLMMIPGLGSSLQTLALARIAWSLNLTLESGMDLRRAIPLSLASSQNSTFTEHTSGILVSISRGHEISEALAETRVFPRDFLEAIEVGERSGRLSEAMVLLSRRYQEQALAALTTLTVIAGFAVWALVAALIIMLIFRIAMFYIGTINNALQM